MKKILSVIIGCVMAASSYAYMPPNSAEQMVSCVALFDVVSDMYSSKNVNGFLDSRPESKQDFVKSYYSPEKAKKADSIKIEAAVLANRFIKNVNLKKLTPYYYDNWSIQLQEDFNISYVRALNSVENYTSACQRTMSVFKQQLDKGEFPQKLDFTGLTEADQYSPKEKAEQKKYLSNLRKPIPLESK